MSQEATNKSMGSVRAQGERRFVAYNGLTVMIGPQGHASGERLPISDAKAAVSLQHNNYPDVRVSVLDWYCTCLRVSGKSKERVAEVGEHIKKGWLRYEGGAHGFISEGEKGLHYALGTAVSEERGRSQMHLILRSGAPSEGMDGVTEIDPAFRCIKEGRIGLTEAQGLFVFPERLLGPLCGLKEALLKRRLPEELKPFTLLYAEMMATAIPRTAEEAERAIGEELGYICERMLRDTAVFETYGDTANFLKGLGFHEG